jgi:HK97 family phage major capsid protein
VSETGVRSETDASQLIEVAPTFGEVYAAPHASEWALDDMFFNVENWLADSAAASFAAAEAVAVVSGDGSSKPSGLLKVTPSESADDASPARAAGALQYVQAGSPPALTAAHLVETLEQFGDSYLESASAAWVMSRGALADVRGLSFGNARSFVEASAPGAPPMLLGLPVFVSAAMSAPGASGYPVVCGDFSRGYGLADRGSMRLSVNEVSSPGTVRFYVRRRVGGSVLDANALKLLQL